MKLAKRFAVLAILSIGLFMNHFTDSAQANSCYYCVSARQSCLSYCNTLPPGQEQTDCRIECYEGYNECMYYCNL